jgi:hypothetical protein
VTTRERKNEKWAMLGGKGLSLRGKRKMGEEEEEKKTVKRGDRLPAGCGPCCSLLQA